ncbi:MBOAT family protein [[Flexibacter] sp. ATCC 35103]|uniref:MBOAT family O-acyltransferase n=1 Tax=[Flexibacter] sp. ATCC 35103 TaxID=1937528 RepID=UPI0009CB6AF6|nr:MBOAT family O-acyltransferase [[Flexibacter] sp. ATCC 35103]OMQ11596.1 membrane-bound O-acyltransferase family protein [[Flexibacter] sp. ATCC 35103]
MLFNSLNFAFFLPLIFILYWFVANRNLKLQNLLLLVSSYFFYAFWDWRFLFLLVFSTLLDYYSGIKISDTSKTSSKRFWFWLSISVNLCFLGVFKYYNFFVESFVDLFAGFGFTINATTLNIVLPVGISFYTFHGLSYVIDIYKKRITAEKSFVDYAVFVSFFPLLVAGPIERATHLLPQIKNKRIFSYEKASNGLRQILWGLFKKIVIADTCSIFVDDIFQNYSDYSGGTLILGAVLFSFQIYCDFSGYSDIAIGVAKLLGIDLITNFKTPYFSRNIADFWRRWHISLSSWFRDYVYIPLGGSQVSLIKSIRNIFIIFILSGFWHGANWTFIFWGALNALYFIPSFLMKSNRKYLSNNHSLKNDVLSKVNEFKDIFITFGLTTFAWIFFRSSSLADAIKYIKGIFKYEGFFTIQSAKTYELSIRRLFFYIGMFLIIEWYYKNEEVIFTKFHTTKTSTVLKYLLYMFAIISIMFSIKNQAASFIYFQF